MPRHVPPVRSHSFWAVAADAGAEATDSAQPATLAVKRRDPTIVRTVVRPRPTSILIVLALPPARHVVGDGCGRLGVQRRELEPGRVVPP